MKSPLERVGFSFGFEDWDLEPDCRAILVGGARTPAGACTEHAAAEKGLARHPVPGAKH